MNPPNIYIIPGLGLNENLFFKWKINAPVHFINWIEPLSIEESLEEYTTRMMEQMHHKENIILIGMSFGGVIAQEIGKMMAIDQIILVSSIKTHHECPFTFKIMKMLPLFQWSTPKMRHRTRKIWGRYFGLKTREALDFFEEMIEQRSELYRTWGIKQIAEWKNETYPDNLLHIHGDKDLVFPIYKIRNPDLILKGGTHGAVVTHADQINTFLNEKLKLNTVSVEN